MKDISKLTASEILALATPEQLFTGEAESAKSQYRLLSKLWHPDLNKAALAASVFAQVNDLYHKGVEKLRAGTWETPGLYVFSDVKGKQYQVKYKRKHDFELGEMYVGEHTVTYFIDKAQRDLYERARKTIKSFKYANDKMKAEVERYLPTIHTESETADRLVMVVKKDPDLLLLRDVLDHLKGKLDPKHVAWVLNTMYNTFSYLKYSGLTHNSISLDTYFISPQKHTGALLGGWWYSAAVNDKLVAIPSRTLTYAPHGLTSKKIATPQIDSELIRATGRELLGDGGGSKLLADPGIPNAMLSWLRTAGSGDAYREYEDWSKKVLKSSFGERRFVELKIQPSDVYKE